MYAQDCMMMHDSKVFNANNLIQINFCIYYVEYMLAVIHKDAFVFYEIFYS